MQTVSRQITQATVKTAGNINAKFLVKIKNLGSLSIIIYLMLPLQMLFLLKSLNEFIRIEN